VKPIEQVCVLLVLQNKREKNESHNVCMELWRTSPTVASSRDLLHPQPPPDFFSCVSLHPGNLSGALVYIFFFFRIGVANGKAVWLQFLFYVCLWV
jgi:hypothetical protein